MNAFMLIALLSMPQAVPAKTIVPTQPELLKDWAAARCIARGVGFDTEGGADASRSAAALLERGDYGADVYETLDRMAARRLTRPQSGSSGGRYVTLTCFDWRRSAELDRVVRSFPFRPTAR